MQRQSNQERKETGGKEEMRKELYIVAVNLVPQFQGTRVECQRFVKALKKSNRSNPYYIPGWDTYYCGKLSGFRVGFNKADGRR